MVVRSKAWVSCRSTGIAGSNSSGDVDVCVVWYSKHKGKFQDYHDKEVRKKYKERTRESIS